MVKFVLKNEETLVLIDRRPRYKVGAMFYEDFAKENYEEGTDKKFFFQNRGFTRRYRS